VALRGGPSAGIGHSSESQAGGEGAPGTEQAVSDPVPAAPLKVRPLSLCRNRSSSCGRWQACRAGPGPVHPRGPGAVLNLKALTGCRCTSACPAPACSRFKSRAGDWHGCEPSLLSEGGPSGFLMGLVPLARASAPRRPSRVLVNDSSSGTLGYV